MSNEKGFISYIVASLLALSLAGISVYKVYDTGRDVERTEWLEKELKAKEKHQKEVEKLEAQIRVNEERLARQVAYHEHKLQEIEHDKLEEIQKRNTVIDGLRNSRLFVNAECKETVPVHGNDETENTVTSSSTPGRIELPRAFAEDLITLAEDAQKVVEQYNACRRWLSLVTTVVPSGLD